MKYRKKPVVVEAMQYDGTRASALEIFEWSSVPDELGGVPMRFVGYGSSNYCLSVTTLEGEMLAMPMDWIIKGVKGEFYPCKPDIFALTYEPVDDSD